MFEIAKQFTFAAGHRLAGLPATHKCSRIHGHGYIVEVRLAAVSLDGPGFVLDYADLDPFAAWLGATYDHRWLGSGSLLDEDGGKTLPAVGFNPTAELLAAHFRDRIAGELPALQAAARPVTIHVGVSETPKTWAWSR